VRTRGQDRRWTEADGRKPRSKPRLMELEAYAVGGRAHSRRGIHNYENKIRS